MTGFVVLMLGIGGFALILIPTVPLVPRASRGGSPGSAMGLSYSTLSIVVLRESPPETQGAATAGLQLSDVLGTSLGTGLGGALIAFGLRAGSPTMRVGLAATFGIAAAVALGGFLLTRRLGPRVAAGRSAAQLDAVAT